MNLTTFLFFFLAFDSLVLYVVFFFSIKAVTRSLNLFLNKKRQVEKLSNGLRQRHWKHVDGQRIKKKREREREREREEERKNQKKK